MALTEAELREIQRAPSAVLAVQAATLDAIPGRTKRQTEEMAATLDVIIDRALEHAADPAVAN